MKTKLIVIISILSITLIACQAQEKFYVAFWNLENLFDTVDDPKNDGDDEFLPESKSEWTLEKFDKKLSNLSKVIRSMNNGFGPDILGVCEVENGYSINQLAKKFLLDLNYDVVHYESSDSRGIDVGLLYRKDKFICTHSEKIRPMSGTRDILYAVLRINKEDIHVFVNHWPSRRTGEKESEPRRIKVASILRAKVDSILAAKKNANIVIMGDFNDMPDNRSILMTLLAVPFECDQLTEEYTLNLYNTAYKKYKSGYGTFFFQGNFNMLDQIIISKGLLDKKGLDYNCDSFEIISNELNTTRSGQFKGAPFPTYGRGRYLGGYSDHFPVGVIFHYLN